MDRRDPRRHLNLHRWSCKRRCPQDFEGRRLACSDPGCGALRSATAGAPDRRHVPLYLWSRPQLHTRTKGEWGNAPVRRRREQRVRRRVWRPESGVKGTGAFRFMVMLGGGADILGAFVVPGGGCGAWPELAGRVEQRAAQVLQQPQAIGRHGQAAHSQPREARSSTAQTRVRQEVSPGRRPMTLVRRRVSPKVRSMKFECRIRRWCSAGNRR